MVDPSPTGPRLVTTSVDDRQPSLSSLAAEVDAATSALERLAAVAALAAMLDAVERDAVEQARAGGLAWSAIGEQLGVTKQAAAKRFGPKTEPAPAVARAPRPDQSWEVTTRGGRTLLRFVKQPRRPA